jgi:putative membrane protein
MDANSLPAVNAGLNGACAMLLVFGYRAIRAQKQALHATCMTCALALSGLFLTSYLYYHIVVRSGQPTRFAGSGWVRPLYFAILISHTLLAAVVAPLALFTAWQGYQGRLRRHVRIAHWTLPIWFYVSLTGVIVYLMLYHLYPVSQSVLE